MAADTLGTYLNDHLAGATAGCELAERIASANRGTPLGAFASDLLGEIQADRDTLAGLIDQLDQSGKRPLKQAAGWAGEKLGRLKLSEKVSGGPDLSRLLELETLEVGIKGKELLWRSLRAVGLADPRVAALDLDRLLQRAEQQMADVEQHRLEAAARGLAS